MASKRQLKHGLTSSTLIVLPEEDPHEYQQVLRGFRESLQPHDATEEALVLRLAQAHWRSLRARKIETGMLTITADTQRARAREIVEDCPEHLNPHNAIAVGFMTMPAERWQMYLRYDTTISRDFFRTLDTLMKLQRQRAKQAVGQAVSPANSIAVAQQAVGQAVSPANSIALSDSGIRSVSQNSTSVPDLNQPKELTHDQKNRKPTNPPGDEHFETLGELLTQLKNHLTAEAGKKGTYGDYLRLLEFYHQTRGVEARNIIVRWVDHEKLDHEDLAIDPAA